MSLSSSLLLVTEGQLRLSPIHKNKTYLIQPLLLKEKISNIKLKYSLLDKVQVSFILVLSFVLKLQSTRFTKQPL